MTSDDGRGSGRGQLPLEFPHEISLGVEDFFISPSNEPAYDLIEAWPNWPKRTLLLVGPAGSGKTHLSTIWSHAASAVIFHGDQLSREAVPKFAEHDALVIEDLPGAALDDTALFHLLNLVNDQRRHLLMTASEFPASWGVSLPDLASRLRAVPVMELGLPDEALLRAVLVKLFADRQLAVEESVISYLLPRMERSIAAARRLVDVVDRTALTERAPVTRPFVAKVLREIDGMS